MSKLIKQMEMDSLKADFKEIRDLVVLNTRGLGCQGDHLFRANLRKKNIRLKMVKNSLARRIFGELGLSVSEDPAYWEDATTFAYGAGSLAELSREIDGELKSAKNAPVYKDTVKVKGAISDGAAVSFEQALKMPTRLEAVAQVIMLALAPASRLLSQLAGPASSVAGQIKSISEKTPETPAPASI
jgi:large subunit ribosomal protein L10